MGTSTLALGSGCLNLISSGSDASPKLGWVVAKNYHSNTQRLEIRIERGDSVVHESSHEIAGKTVGRIPGEVLEYTWGTTPARTPYADELPGASGSNAPRRR